MQGAGHFEKQLPPFTLLTATPLFFDWTRPHLKVPETGKLLVGLQALEVVTVASLDLPPLLPLVAQPSTGRSTHSSPPLGNQLLQGSQGLLQPLPCDRAAGQKGPVDPSTEVFQAKTLFEARQVDRSRQVLLVGEDEDGHRLPLGQPADPLQLQLGLLQALLVTRVNDEDDCVGRSCVRPPERSCLVLAPDVPDVEDPTQSRLHLRMLGSMEILESSAGGFF